MTSLEKIQKYIEKYEDLFVTLNKYDLPYPFIYTNCDEISDEDYYDCNFSLNTYIYMLFFNGSKIYFSGMYVPSDLRDVRCDKCPIYIFDLQDDVEPVKKIGNFKTYMTNIFSALPKHMHTNDVVYQAMLDLSNFSDDIINREYILTINTSNI